MILCCYCDYAHATRQCTVCHTSNNAGFFCSVCSKLHLNQKENSGHLFTDVPQTSNQCSNCEHSKAKFYCLDCPPNEGRFCLGCSIIHPKIKATRNHRVYLSDDNENSTEQLSGCSLSLFGVPKLLLRSFLKLIPTAEFLDVLQFFEIPVHTVQLTTLLAVFSIAIFCLHFFLRRAVGRNVSSIFTIIGTIGLLRFLQGRQKKRGTKV